MIDTETMSNVSDTPVVATALPGPVLRNALAACVLSVEKGKYGTLPVLEAVQVVKVGDVLTFRATDRYRLTQVTVTVKDAPEGDWETIIPAADVKRIVGMLPKTGVLLVTLAPDIVTVVGSASLSFTPVDAQFPKVENVIPTTTEAVEEIGIRPEQLADLAKMPGRRKNVPLFLKFNGVGKPVRVTWTDEDHENVDYLYLMMPVRKDT